MLIKIMFDSLGIKVVILSCLSLLLAVWIASASKSVDNMEIDSIKTHMHIDSNIGQATKCDPLDPTHVSITWSPKDLSPSEQVDIIVSYAAPHDMYSGSINASLYFHGEPDPFLGYFNTFSCNDIKDYFTQCPLLRRTKFTFPKNITNLHPLTSFPGHYDAVVDVKNEKNERMFCLNISVLIKEI